MTNLREVFELIDDDRAIQFLKELIQINTVNPPGEEKKLATLIFDRFEKLEMGSLKLNEIDLGRANLVTSINGKGDKHLVFSGHFDTVPIGESLWRHPPFNAVEENGKIYGRGSSDMKSGVAAMLIAMEVIKKSEVNLKGTLTFVGTVGEEVDARGAKKIIENNYIGSATAMVVGEPTDNQVSIAHKGTLWLKIYFLGKTAHGSMPELGVNAIMAANKFLNRFETYHVPGGSHPELGISTTNVGVISGGTSANVVPDSCYVTVDIRTVPGQDHKQILSDMNDVISDTCEKSGADYKIEILNSMPAVATGINDPFIELSLNTSKNLLNDEQYKTVNYYTDASIYKQHLNIPILIYGPGQLAMAHQPDEYVEVSKFLDSIRYYTSLALGYLG